MKENPLVDLALALASRRLCSHIHIAHVFWVLRVFSLYSEESNSLWRQLIRRNDRAGSMHYEVASTTGLIHVSSPSYQGWNHARLYLHTKHLFFICEILPPSSSVISSWPSTCRWLVMVFVFCAGLHMLLFNFSHGCLSLTQISKQPVDDLEGHPFTAPNSAKKAQAQLVKCEAHSLPGVEGCI